MILFLFEVDLCFSSQYYYYFFSHLLTFSSPTVYCSSMTNVLSFLMNMMRSISFLSSYTLTRYFSHFIFGRIRYLTVSNTSAKRLYRPLLLFFVSSLPMHSIYIYIYIEFIRRQNRRSCRV